MDDCDLLVMVGTDFPYLDFYPEAAKVIQIDIDPTRIGRRAPGRSGAGGRGGPVLRALADGIDGPRSEARS